MNAVKTADHIAVHHVNHRLGHGSVDPLMGLHAFLDDDVHDRIGQLGFIAFVLGRPGVQVFHVVHRHDAHAASALPAAAVAFDQDKGLFMNAVLLVLALDFHQEAIDLGFQVVKTLASRHVYLPAMHEHRVDQPRVDANQLAKTLGHFFVRLEVVGLVAHRAAGM